MSELELKGKTGIVTGASSGIGFQIANVLAEAGATVYAVSRTGTPKEGVGTSSPGVIHVKGDIGDQAAMKVLLAEITASSAGVLDFLVNNAGVLDKMYSVTEVEDEFWDKVMSININSVMYACRKAIPIMMKNGGGSIINTASVGGLFGCRAGAAYTASKFAVVGLTKNIGFMYAKEGIRCNAICPGSIITNIAAGLSNASEFGMARSGAGVPLSPRMGQPEEIANTALFLASDESSFINGTTVTVDGGWTAY